MNTRIAYFIAAFRIGGKGGFSFNGGGNGGGNGNGNGDGGRQNVLAAMANGLGSAAGKSCWFLPKSWGEGLNFVTFIL